MSKSLYLECRSGISGDMTLGALIDLGADKEQFLTELKKLNLEGYEIAFETTQRNAITATHVNVLLTDQEKGHTHSHDHQHIHDHEHEHDHCEMHDHEHMHDHDHDH